MRGLALLMVLLVATQGVFWYRTQAIEPRLEVVPAPPGKTAVEALSLGDREAYFRVLALQMQNFGDTYGRFTSLRFYDFSRLSGWFYLLDGLDPRSDLLPTMAATYFSQTQNTPDVRYMVDFLYDHASRDVATKWWWLLQGTYLASYKLQDLALASKVADKMIDPQVPVWAQQMAAVVHEKRGEMEDALRIMETIRDHAVSLSKYEMNYMTYFVKERLHKLDELEKFEAKHNTSQGPAIVDEPLKKAPQILK